MRRRGYISGLIALSLLLLHAVAGSSPSVDISFSDRDAGYFLKPLFQSKEESLAESKTQESHFVIGRPYSPVSVKANYGLFTAQEQISPELLQTSLGNQSSKITNIMVSDLDISAHIVSRSIMPDRRVLQVLFHASHIKHDTTTKGKKASIDLHEHSTKWCLELHVEKDGEELTSVCVLNTSAKDNVCLAEVTLPETWWEAEHTPSVDVYFSMKAVNDNLQCSTSSNSIVPDKSSSEQRVKSFVSKVTLANKQITYTEVKEDQHVLVYIPEKNYHPGSKFTVPVKLQAESDLTLFIIRVKARRGLRVVTAEAIPKTPWRIQTDLNRKNKGGTVTAFVQDKNRYTKMSRIQHIFDLVFEVEPDVSPSDDAGKIILNLEYEVTGQNREYYGSVENRVRATIPIHHDHTFAIVPVIKSTELVNKAILTGRLENYPMRIYSVSQTGAITDITSQTTCHSGDYEVLKVAESCNQIYLDGSETKGSLSISVIAKYGHHTKFLFFKVWVPEYPLGVELSDSKLSQIKGWKAPKHLRRSIRGVQFGLLTHPGLLLQEEDNSARINTDEYHTKCNLRFQQATINIYTRFVAPDGTRNQYMGHRKAFFDITDLVKDRLRVADSSIAMLSEDVVEGVKPGRTEVQVLSREGRVIGASEIRVGHDKVEIERLVVDVVTGLEVSVSSEPQLPGTLVAKVTKLEKLSKKYQEGLLDIRVKFTDGNVMPLKNIPPSDYFLDMDTLNNHMVAFGPMLTPDCPRVIALGQGKGELLKLALELGDSCQRKKSKPLAVSYVYTVVDFSKDPSQVEILQNDGHFGNVNNRASSGRYDTKQVKTDKGTFHVIFEMDKDTYVKPQPTEDPKNLNEKTDFEVYGSSNGIAIDPNDLDELARSDTRLNQPSQEAQQQQLMAKLKMTPLEIGMYALLGVFCLAILVFMVNCIVFVVRYRKKQLPYEATSTVANANDWVWIGRATLERNAINTQCSQTLMAEADFNGNQNNPTLLQAGTSSGPSSNRSSGCSASSNRNSYVSTYKGSECSIRITANPIPPDENDNLAAASASTSAEAPAGTSGGATLPPPPPLLRDPHAEDTANNNHPEAAAQPANVEQDAPPALTTAPATAAPPIPPHTTIGGRPIPPGAVPHTNPDGTISETEWDYEQMGLTYDQLMEYFDNLKESTA